MALKAEEIVNAKRSERKFYDHASLSDEQIIECMELFATQEIERLMKEHLSQNVDCQLWCFSPDLGGAVDSGFAWAEYDYDFSKREQIKPNEGKDLDSLLERVSFKVGEPGIQRWVPVGESPFTAKKDV